MATLDDIGESVELQMSDKGESVAIAIAGTYIMTLLFQREVTPGGGAWETLRTFNTEDETVAEIHVTEKFNEKLRLFVLADTSGSTTSTLTDSALEDQGYLAIKDRVGNAKASFDQGGVEFPGSLRYGGALNFTASATLTKKQHAGRLLRMNAAAGLTLTLPTADGSGAIYRFLVETEITSSNAVIEVAVAADVMQGMVSVSDSGDATSSDFQTASTSDTITMDGDTKGGKRGDYIEIEDVAVGLYRVIGFLAGDATQGTPVSAAVS